jgi:hypothetical protein
MVDESLASLCEQLAGLTDEALDLYLNDFLAALHESHPEVVWLKNPPPNLRVVH